MQARDRLAERVHRGDEVAGGPGRQAEEAGGGTAGEVVVRPGQRECAAGVRDRAVDVAAGLGERGAVDRDHGREGAQLLVPGAGRLGQRSRGYASIAAGRRLQGPSRRRRATPPPRRGRPRRAGSSARNAARSGRRRTTSSGSARSHSRRVRSCRRLRRSASASSTRSAARSWSPPAIAWVTASASSAVLGVPAAGGPVQLGHPVRMLGEEPGAQCVGEQVVVAVPPALVVERDDEQVLALEGLEHRLAVVAAGQRVAQRAGQLRRAPRCRAGTRERRRAGGRAPPRPGSPGRTGGCRRTPRRSRRPHRRPRLVRPRADSAASCSPAAHPSVRASRAATCAGSRSSPITSLRNASASSAVNRRSAARTSTSSPRRAQAGQAAAAGPPAWSSPA